ncbi:hypothetical protein GW17_00018272 [Ensete ventricosum]|nr:hypothetical protein GW17_00018272 [Ensete ventricosum]
MDLGLHNPGPNIRSLKDTLNLSPPLPPSISLFGFITASFDTGTARLLFRYRIPHALQSDCSRRSRVHQSDQERRNNRSDRQSQSSPCIPWDRKDRLAREGS